jgi:hypothetical protein
MMTNKAKVRFIPFSVCYGMLYTGYRYKRKSGGVGPLFLEPFGRPHRLFFYSDNTIPDFYKKSTGILEKEFGCFFIWGMGEWGYDRKTNTEQAGWD